MVATYIEDNLDQLVNEFSKHDEFSFDLETSGLNPLDSRILLAQVGFRDCNYVINGRVNLAPILPFFPDKRWKKIIQNAKFDTKFMFHYYKTPTRNVFDTYLAEKLITPQDDHVSASLEALALKYLGIKLDKTIRTSFINMTGTVFSDEQLKYAGLDTEVLFGIMDKQKEKITEFGLDRVAEIEFELAPIVAAMELAGVPIDIPKWKQIIQKHREQHEASRIKMNDLIFDTGKLFEQTGMFVRDSINLNSPQQIKRAFLALGIDIDSTNEREIALINHPVARELLNYRGLQKIMTSYGDSFLDKIHPFTGRIHADFQQIGTATGRFACKEPNLQQMPEEFRECVTLPDYKIVVADYSQIELRILAEYSGDAKFKTAFDSGEDLHKATAATMFNLPIKSITPAQRFIAKTINFGLAYGMGPKKLQDMLNAKRESGQPEISFTKARGLMDRYKESYVDVIRWLDAAGKLAYRRGYSETMMGRRRWFNRPNSKSTNYEGEIASIKRQGANSPIQGTNADITKLAMLNIYHDLRTYGIKAEMILQVHDEIGVLAHKSDAENVKSIVVESMEKAAQELLVKVPVRVDAYVNDIWKKGG
jgi:DNA polymerase-1